MRRLAVTVPVVLLLGVTAALVLMPRRDLERALQQIQSSEIAERQRGWDWLLAPTAGGETRADRHGERLYREILEASDAAVLDAGAALRHARLWSWSNQPAVLVLREAKLRAHSAESAAARPALDTMRTAPLDLPPTEVLAVLTGFLMHADIDIRHDALSIACGWIGVARPHLLRQLGMPPDDINLQRRLNLALAWSESAADTQPAVDWSPDEPIDVLEAKLFRLAQSEPSRVEELIDLARGWETSPRPAFEYVLMHCDEPRAGRALGRLAARGSRTAAFALQARSRSRDDASSQAIVGDVRQAAIVRQMAAWRWENVPSDRVLDVLDDSIVDADGSVSAAALLAEKRLPRPAAVVLAERWIRSFDDDRKRAGALLALLLNEHRSLLEHAQELEDMPSVRTTQQLALSAMPPGSGRQELTELAHRTIHARDGEFDPDAALCLLAAGRSDALALLTSQPGGEWREAVRRRAWLIERFAPELSERAGRPIGGDIRALRLHFDGLDVLRSLLARRLTFDDSSRTYSATMTAPQADDPEANASTASRDRSMPV